MIRGLDHTGGLVLKYVIETIRIPIEKEKNIKKCEEHRNFKFDHPAKIQLR